MLRAGNAALRRAADRPLALRPPHGRPAADDRHRRRAPPAARRTVLAGAERPGARHRVGRRHEEIPVPHARRALRRVGLHPRRGAGHALRLVAGRMPHGLPLLRHGAAGASAVAHGGRNPQPGGFAARARQTHEPRVHGHGRTARQHGRGAAGARDNHRRVGFRLVADTHHALHGGRRARIAAFSRRDEGSPGRQPPQPLPRRAYGDHARRTGVADRRSRRDPARIRLHPPAAGVVRIHRDERAERLPAPHPRTDAPAERHQMPHQPDPLPPDSRLALLLARRRGDGPLPRRADRPRHSDHDPRLAGRGHPGRMRVIEHPSQRRDFGGGLIAPSGQFCTATPKSRFSNGRFGFCTHHRKTRFV